MALSYKTLFFSGITFAATLATAHAATYEVLYAFQQSDDGSMPIASLINVGGTLYGTTVEGGAFTNCGDSTVCGTVFSLNPVTDTEKVVYSFQAGSGGRGPSAGLINVDGLLYGTAYYGGSSTKCASDGCGIVFSINPKTGAEKVVYAFQGGNDGQGPVANLINVGGTLYGTTSLGGGPLGNGTVFSVNPKTGAEKIVHAFQGAPSDGFYPLASLISVGGMLYGTTDGGGTYNAGTVFSLNPTTGAMSILHSFGDGGHDGFGPYAGLIVVNGTLYGTTYAGGAHGGGTVFSLNPATGSEKIVHSFGAAGDGYEPEAGLINVGGTLYGTTYGGTIFSVKLSTGVERVVHVFGSVEYDGSYPLASLIDVGGTLYGTTSSGGNPNCACGTVFALKP